MLQPLKRWLAPPLFPADAAAARRAELLNAALLNIVTLIPVFVLGNALGGRTPWPVCAANAAAVALCLVLRSWMRRGRVQLASIGLMTLGFILITASAASLGTVRAPVTAMYPLLVITGGLLFGVRGMLATTALCALAIGGVIVAENAGALPRPDFTVTITQWVAYTAICGWTGSLTLSALRALRAAQTSYRAIFENAVEGIFQSSPQGHFLAVNPAMARLYGYASPVEMVASINDIRRQIYADPEDRVRFTDQLAEADFVEGFEARNLRQNGSLLWSSTNARAVKDNNGQTLYYEGFVTDITARKHAEAALATSERHLRGVLDSSPDTIYTVDLSSGKTIFLNREEFCGYSREELEASGSILYAVHPDDLALVRAHWEQFRITGSASPVEYRVQRKTGGWVWIQQRAAVLTRRPDQTPCQLLVTLSDVTERKQVERILQARLRLLEFAAAHSLEELLRATLDELETLTGSPIGFYHFLAADQRTLALQAWSTGTLREFCTAEGKGRHYDVAEAGVWVDCIHQRRPVIHNDYAALPHRKGTPPGHAAVIRELVVPVFRGDRIVAVLGVGNKPENYTERDVETVSQLADLAWDIAERKRVEEALRESEEKYRRLFEVESDALFMLSRETAAIVEVNDAAVLLYQYRRDELLKMNAIELSAEPDESHRMLSDTSGRIPIRYHRKKDGAIFPVEILFSDFDYLGHPMRMVTVRDITVRLQAEERLRESEQRYATLFNHSGIPTALVKLPQVVIVDVNQAMEELVGYHQQEMIGKTAVELGLGSPQDSARLIAKFEQEGSLASDPARILTRSGETRLVESNTTPIVLRGQPHAITTMKDITERKRAEEALHESETRLRLALQIAPITIFRQDGDLKYTWIDNLQATMRPEDVVGKSDADFVPAEQAAHLTELKRRALSSGDRVRETVNVVVQEVASSYEMIVEPMRDAAGQIVGVMGVTWDITERQRAEEQLRALSSYLLMVREEESGRIARAVHDELGQALTGLKMDLAWLGNRLAAVKEPAVRGPLAQRVQEMAGLTAATIETVRRITAELRPGVLDDLGLVAALEWQAQDFERRCGIRCEFGSALADVTLEQGRATELFRICQEALTNAARHAGASRVTVTLNQEAGQLILQVRDDGQGITADALADPRAFGLLGMAERARMAAGELTIASQPGQGSTVTVRVPLRDPKGLRDL